jgi:benzoate 4-monooxygenase
MNSLGYGKELDDAYAARGLPLASSATYDMVKDLSYRHACIDEAIRLRPYLPGLSRAVPAGDLHATGWVVWWRYHALCLHFSTETVHRDSAAFHDSPEEYGPERWLEPGCNAMRRGFLGFRQGGRACLGRNIACFETSLLIDTLFLGNEFALRGAKLGQL